MATKQAVVNVKVNTPKTLGQLENELEQINEQQKLSGANANDKYHIGHILIATPEAATPEDI